jgi:hypothetical protein
MCLQAESRLVEVEDARLGVFPNWLIADVFHRGGGGGLNMLSCGRR